MFRKFWKHFAEFFKHFHEENLISLNQKFSELLKNFGCWEGSKLILFN